jgi:hypothetical protein
MDGFNLPNDILVLPDGPFDFGDGRQLIAWKIMMAIVVNYIINPAF